MPRKILIMVFKGIGDVLLTTPLIRALKKQAPDSEIYFLTKPPSEKILRFNPYLTGVFIRGKTTLAEIRARALDVSLDFMNSSASGAYALLSGARKRLAFKHPLGRIFHNELVARSGTPQYTVYDRLELIKALGVPDDGIALDLRFGPANAKKAIAFLKRAGVDPAKTPLVTFDVTSPRQHRRWAPEKFAALADRLREDFQTRAVFLAGPGELDYVKKALSSAKMEHLLCHDFDLLDLAALSRSAALHVGTSSAPMHIAVSQGTPTFTMYSFKNSPESWGPPGAAHAGLQGDLETLDAETAYQKLSAHMKALSK